MSDGHAQAQKDMGQSTRHRLARLATVLGIDGDGDMLLDEAIKRLSVPPPDISLLRAMEEEISVHRDVMKFRDSQSAMTSLDERRRNAMNQTDLRGRNKVSEHRRYLSRETIDKIFEGDECSSSVCPHGQLTRSCPICARDETINGLREALKSVKSALGDRLLAKGPLSTEYAHAITKEINTTLSGGTP